MPRRFQSGCVQRRLLGWREVRLKMQAGQSKWLGSICGLAVFILSFYVNPIPAFGQNSDTKNSSAQSANAEILQELERMRVRIQDLEEKLRNQASVAADHVALSHGQPYGFVDGGASPGSDQEANGIPQ